MLTNENILQIVQNQKVAVHENPADTIEIRITHLNLIKKLIVEHEKEWLDALSEDLKKPFFESYVTEIAVVLNEVDFTKKKLKKWLKPSKYNHLKLGSIESWSLTRKPYGSVLIISPWNYPLQLSVMPVIGAIASGNRVVLKPSEHAPAVSALLARIIPLYFQQDVFTIVTGDAKTADYLLDLPFDFIFFTGSSIIGKIIYEKAAKQLIPVVLELGGKNPCILDESGMSKESIQQIVWGKFLNTGQTCVAPDTLYVHESVYHEALAELKKTIEFFYGGNPESSPDYGRLIHQKHFNHVATFLNHGDIVYGGEVNRDTNYISPTILINIQSKESIHNEEIFGPILPVIPYKNLDELLTTFDNHKDALSTYIFTKNKYAVQKIADHFRTSAIGVNNCVEHVASTRIPFGGVGLSGIGRYHGKASINTFTFEQVQYKSFSYAGSNKQFPPYDMKLLKWVKKFRRWLI